jgi:lysophospholipase L1-like esterase
MIKPIRFLVLLAIVSGLAAILMAVVPERGWALGTLTLRFPTWQSFLEGGARQQGVAMEEFYDMYSRKGSADSLEAVAYRERMKYFQFPDDDPCLYDAFFAQLETLSANRRVRILHFGDSQIEGARISSDLNRAFQQRYGGGGPGWIPVVDIVPSGVVRQENSGNWQRFSVFGYPKSKAHKRYGLMGAFARFTDEIVPAKIAASDSLMVDSIQLSSVEKLTSSEKKQAWFSIAPYRRSSAGFNQVKLAFGHFNDTLNYRISAGEKQLDAGSILPEKGLVQREWNFSGAAGPIRFEWEAADSPDFYGLALQQSRGVYVDNIAMRGSSGTEFHKMDLSLLKQQVGEDDVALIMLQFGGNTMPGMKSSAQVNDYGRYFKGQIRWLKTVFPNAAFLVIGPSDMSLKDGLEFVTYPFLPEVRDALKAAAFAEGAAYWDTYEAMGGKNSMPSWVNADPALAASDYVHFTNAGAQKIADWLFEAFNESESRIKSRMQ